MKEKTYHCLQPIYVQQFQCDGSLCKSECCRKGWAIEIDEDTYRRYCNIGLTVREENVANHIRHADFRHQKSLLLQPTSEGACPFLREDWLCDIHRTYGFQFLPIICLQYPRYNLLIGDMGERSLRLSCPVAARLILLQRTPMEFEWIPFPDTGRETWIDMSEKETPLKTFYPRHFVRIQSACIHVLQNRNLSLDQRWIALGFFMDQADRLMEDGTMEELSHLASFYASDRIMEHVAEMAANIPFHPSDYIKQIFGLLESLYGEQGASHDWASDARHLSCIADAFGLSANGQSQTAAVLADRYMEIRETFGKPLLQKYGHIFENYIVHECFSNLYPCKLSGTFVHNYKTFLLFCKMSEFAATVAAYMRQKDSIEEALMDTLKMFSMRMAHTSGYLGRVEQEAKRIQSDLISFMGSMLDGH